MWQSHFPSDSLSPEPARQNSCFAQFLRNLLWTGKNKGKCHEATTPMSQWKRHQGKQVNGTYFEILKLNEKAKCHRSLGCLYISGPGQGLFVHICQGFSVALGSQVPMEAIHSSQHRLVLNVTESWQECPYPIFSLGWMAATGVERGRKSPWAFALLLATVYCSLPEEQSTGLFSCIQSEMTDPRLNETPPYFPKFDNMLFTLNQGRFWPSIIASQDAAMADKENALSKEQDKFCQYRLDCPDFTDSQQDELPITSVRKPLSLPLKR